MKKLSVAKKSQPKKTSVSKKSQSKKTSVSKKTQPKKTSVSKKSQPKKTSVSKKSENKPQTSELKTFFQKMFYELSNQKIQLSNTDETKIKGYIGKIISKIFDLNTKPDTFDKILEKSLGEELARHALKNTQTNRLLRDYLISIIGTRKLFICDPEKEQCLLFSSEKLASLLSPVVEYLLAEIFELSGHLIRDLKISTIKAMDEAIRNDSQLRLLFI